ncbi:putative spermidine/putrescine transport system ATP-binding protein [Roseinatronobacter bogoriensis subsp. barguzinensis]|uniref:ABC transporter ATP-binding protein n=1 Tax=Roseinatronobacter bogoriensis subsp. barguzinensis TaxID=441209 RepID=A0A2K8KDL2_9RHOB|nr:ABC transporter ATP-binding protein [Rhodobaca barguzinensis]TDW33861.1 putative spermidine/putrescine transport system ATP-binding protein [Rhodobaca barguzinensis]TDY66289.1 putative spermidine/putrescine transport system ATP-binding protein/spermidine/putrescine transport system ATP-binding protein [Rhodobaca bogoriensis DSM 18756]
MTIAQDISLASSDKTAPVLRVENVSKRFGTFTVLQSCSISVSEGEIVTLLGSSGCGKTTLLRCIAGFWAPEEGMILIDGHNTVPVPVNRRPVGVVFQSYALFPHLTVEGNVAYGLRMRGVPRSEISRRVADALESVSLRGFENRYPSQLSGGQQQRVAIARVLVLEPRVLLLDEPFNALDAKLRGTMQIELRELIKRLGMTAIFVTHDQEEALTMSDRIAVMQGGRIEQVAPPDEIFDRPATAYVADFIGLSNFIPCKVRDGKVTLPDGQSVATKESDTVKVMIRPHNLRVTAQGTGPWQGQVRFQRNIGPLIEYIVTAGEAEIRVVAMRQDRTRPWSEGDAISLEVIDPEYCTIYPAV